MACKIIWSTQALEDLRNLTHFIAMDNPGVAEEFGTEIFQKVDVLNQHPLIGRIVPERKTSRFRELIHSPYRIIYRLQKSGASVEIVRIWHAARGKPKI